MAAEVCTQGLDTGFVSLGYAKVAVLGVVQGITELLPISSTAHMRIVPAFLGWRDPGSAFSAAMQLAALAAVIVPEIVMTQGQLISHWKDARLPAVLATTLWYVWRRGMLGPILAGTVTLLLFKLVLGW